MAQHHVTDGGEFDLPRPARSVEQGLADGLLEGGDLLADGRLGEAETFGCPPEGLFGSDRLERGEVADGEIIEHGCPPGGWGECH